MGLRTDTTIFALLSLLLVSWAMAEEGAAGVPEEQQPAGGAHKQDAAAVHIVFVRKPDDVEPEVHHIRTIASVVGSEDAAKEALIYSYKTAASGFAAKLTPQQAEEISIFEKVSIRASSSTFNSKVDMSWMPAKFAGQHFKRWQQRMKIWFTLVELMSVIESDPPKVAEGDPKSVKKAEEWKEKDRLGHACILTALSDVLFDVYSSSTFPTSKTLWDELDRKYNTEDHVLEKFSVGKFLKFHMVEDRSVVEQTHEFLLITHGLAKVDMKLPEKFQVMCIIEKFPKTWEDFGMTLKHREGSISLDDLMRAIAIEEVHRKEKAGMPVEASANLVTKYKNKDSKGKPKTSSTTQMKPKRKIQKEKQGECWVCGQKGHFRGDCPKRKQKLTQKAAGNPTQVNVVAGGASSGDMPSVIAL